MARPGLQRALGALRDGRADALLVVKLDRLTRSIRDLGALIEDYFASGKIGLLSVSEQIDTRSAAGRLVLNMLAAVSQWEREAIGERTAAVMAHMRDEGMRLGRPRFGWRVANGELVEVPEEQAAIGLVRALRNEGRTHLDIASEMTLRGIGDRKWHATQISRILAA